MPDRERDQAFAGSDRAAARLAAMDLLARREHSQDELRRKLRRRFPDAELLEAELGRLVEENLQSDERFAESFARQRAGRGYGPLRIRREMRDRGLSDSTIAAAFECAELDWQRLAEKVFHKKFGEPTVEVEAKERARRVRFMQYRGFGADHFQHLIEI